MTAPRKRTKHRPAAVKTSFVVLCFLGITALGGGVEMLLFPGGNEYIPAEWLDGIPLVESWTIPGLALGIVFGLGSLVTAYGLLRRPQWTWFDRITHATGYHWSWICTLLLGAALLVWILLEVVLIPDRSVVEAIYATVGFGLLFLPLLPSMREYLSLFPDV